MQVSKIRIVFIIDRFWPLLDGAERTLADLAVELQASGSGCTILTARHHPSWPERISFHGIAVHRLAASPPPESDGLRARRAAAAYVRAIQQWLRQNRDSYDIVFVSSLRLEAYAAMTAFDRKSRNAPPIVLRAERPGRNGDCLWQLEALGGRRMKRRLLKADKFIAPSKSIERELIAAGYPRDRIQFIPHSVRIAETQSHKNNCQKTVRSELGEALLALQFNSWAPLAIFTGRLIEENRLETLIDAWSTVAARWPNSRLWIVGDGRQRAMLQARIMDRGLSEQVVLTGEFDNVDELLQAADLFVNPSPLEDLSVSVLEAMTAGLPVVACDNATNRELICDGVCGLLFSPSGDCGGDWGSGKTRSAGSGQCRSLADAVVELLEDLESARRMGEQGRKLVAEKFDLANCVDSYITLFEELLLKVEY